MYGGKALGAEFEDYDVGFVRAVVEVVAYVLGGGCGAVDASEEDDGGVCSGVEELEVGWLVVR